MASGTADLNGFVTSDTVDHYDRIVSEAHGIAYVEYTYVHPLGRSEPNQTGLHSDAHVDGMSRVALIIKQRGALAGMQLAHGGGQTEPSLLGGEMPRGASGLPIPAHREPFPAPQPMSGSEIPELIDAYVAAARRAVSAGFDVIEIHAAHGYLLNQWLSPLTNQRSDEHGGSMPACGFRSESCGAFERRSVTRSG